MVDSKVEHLMCGLPVKHY